MEVRASPDAVDFVGGRGGKLFVWSTSARCCRGATTLLEASTERDDWRDFRRVRAEGIELNVEEGNCIGSTFMDYRLPTAWETPTFELGETTTPSPHHPIGAKGVGESATVGSPDMPMTPDKVWEALSEVGLAE